MSTALPPALPEFAGATMARASFPGVPCACRIRLYAYHPIARTAAARATIAILTALELMLPT